MNMKKFLNFILLLLLCTSYALAQIPIEKYKSEISELKTDKDIEEYWSKLHKIDQEILVNTSDSKIADSISISNMIKTTLIFDIHGTKGYNPNGLIGALPINNLSHNLIGKSQIAYWPIIKKCKEIGGAINFIGGKYPAYELESVALTFYGYSLLGQEPKYPELMKKIDDLNKGSVISNLLEAYEYEIKLNELTEVEVLNSWYLQPFQNLREEGLFEFVKMSDDFIYLKKHDHIQKLILTKTNSNTKIFSIENEPFGWYYEYEDNGALKLFNENDEVLITYSKSE